MKSICPSISTLVLCLLASLPQAAQADPSLQVVQWSEKLRPAVFSADSAETSWASYPLKGVEGSRRPELEARWQADFPAVDGDLTDWPLVRWHAVRNHGSVVRGNWTGAADASMRFAVLWNEQGMFIGIEATDDVLVIGNTDEEPQDTFFLSFGSQSSSVQRWWRGADRTLKLAANGQLRSTAFLRNRHRVAFDAESLGARTAIRRDGIAGGNATLRAEIFVPWRVLFPLLPHSALRPMINISYEDVEDDASTLLSAATRVDSSVVNPSWSQLQFGGNPPQGTWVLSAGSGHLEVDTPLEWAVVKLDATTPWELEVQADANINARLRIQCPVGPAIVRVNGLPHPRSTWQPSRVMNLRLHVGDSSRAMPLLMTPDVSVLSAGLSELDSLEKVHADDIGFPGVPDVYVRLKDVSEVATSELGNWVERRYHGSGILVWRASLWQVLEKRILRAQLLRDQIVDAPGTTARWNAMFPQRTALGVPVGVVLMRGYRSDVDGSIQPYALYVSRAVTAGQPTPLVLALHSVRKDEGSLFKATSLAQQTEKHGWIAVSPYGRGDSGFTLAGETDVLDVLRQVTRDLPVDRKRIFATGAGMGGTGVWLLSLRHADLFAAAAVVSAYGDMDRQNYFQLLGYHPLELFHFETMNPVRLVRPGLQTRYRIFHGRGDPVIADAHARAMHGALQEHDVSSELILDEQSRHGEPLLEQNLAGIFTFFAEQAPGTSGEASDHWFGGTGGPLATVYPRGAFAIVYGSHELPADTPAVGDQRRAGRSVTGPQADRRTALQFAAEWESIFEGRPRVLADTMVTSAMQSEQNLVLVGDPRTNVVLQSIAAELPVQWSGDEFTIAGTTYSFEEYGVVFAAPHPHQADRTVVVVSGMAERLGNFEKSLLKLGTDYIVTNDKHQFVDLGQFDHFVIPRTPWRMRQ